MSKALFGCFSCLLLAVIFTTPAKADGIATIDYLLPWGPVRKTMAWSTPDAVRINEEVSLLFNRPTQQGYTLFKSGQSYTVFPAGSHTLVLQNESIMDIASDLMRGIVNNFGNHHYFGICMDGKGPGSLDDMRPTGARETVAGISGEVYDLTWSGADDALHVDLAVLTDDPHVRELDSVLRSYNAILMAHTDLAGTTSRQEVLDQAASERGLGVLRYGSLYRIKEISEQAMPAGYFDIPAPPMDRNDLRAIDPNIDRVMMDMTRTLLKRWKQDAEKMQNLLDLMGPPYPSHP